MTNAKTSRRALGASIISLLLCVSMLVGATFAWFTDSVQSGMNNIVAGNLDIELEYTKDPSNANSWASVKDKTDLFSDALWEPGHTEVVYLKLRNLGTLALNYQIGINVANETEGTNVAGQTFKLSDSIQFGVVEGQSTKFADRDAAVAAVTNSKKLNEGYTKASSMVAGAADAYMALVVYMPETVGNEANYRSTDIPTIELGINVVATQKTQESDSFGTDYDVLAQGGSTSGAAPTDGIVEYTVMSGDSNVKAATMQISADSVEDTTKPIEISIVPTTLNTNIEVTDAQKAATYEITVSNLKADNTTPIKVELNIGIGLTGVKVYHNAEEITSTYNSTTGYVTFNTTSFSPYTVVHDEVATEDEPADTNLPTATVTEAPAFVGTNIEWSSFGDFSPSNEEQQLEAAYVFNTPHTSETVSESKYKDWLCDFYVSVDKDVPDGAIFLAGNYGTYGWVGFENNGLPVSAGQEVPLLGTAIGGNTDGTTNWTYEQIVDFVSTFTCGVARTHGTDMNTLAGATFTVKLCLINPETNERTAVNTINYTFAESTN